MIATLIGSTGLTGSLLLQQLLADPAITQVIAVSRKPLDLSNVKLTQVLVADLAQLPAVQARLRGDLYFCCLGTTIKAAGSQANFEKVDHAAIVAFAQIAKAHAARSLVLVSAMGANAGSVVFYNRVKGRTEADVTALGLRSLTILQPALLLGPRQEFRLAEKLVARTLVPLVHLLPAGAAKRLVTHADTLARRMLAEGKAAAEGVQVIAAKDI